ncbi:MAG: hypothetical protein ACP5D2_03235 [Candidatus Nanoarchaeia archaeon]
MIKGLLLAISLAITITSLFFLLASPTIIQESLITGAVIGPQQVQPLSIISLLIGLITTFLVLINMR